ncbi:MAG TPA: hypothetical protein DEH78_08450 [Solibacterales bacterium]|nr:hypothetical protein [Bryobacterales bacterium]
MIRKTTIAVLLAAAAHAQDAAPRHELGLTLGTLRGGDRGTGAAALQLGSGTALQANYGVRVAGGSAAALYAEFHFLASPQRLVSSANAALTRDVATIYATPGLRVKFAPKARVSPYAVIGAGYALYEHSLLTLGGQPNGAPRLTHRGTAMFGGGVDVGVWRWLAIRGEVRDFYSGSPSYNTPAIRGGQHNVVAGGGFVLRFGGR